MWSKRAAKSFSVAADNNIGKKFGTAVFLLFITMVSCTATPVQDTSPAPVQTTQMADSKMAPNQPTLRSTADYDKYLNKLKTDPRKLVVLLDFDGTLAPITPHPKDTFMLAETERTLTKLVNRSDTFVAVISGRGMIDIQEKVKIPGMTLAGNHGLEIKYPDGRKYNYPIPEDLQANYTKLYQALKDTVARDNAWVEDKKVSITFHYRLAPLEIHDELRDKAKALMDKYGYKANFAHCAVEAKPPVEWNKGYAAAFIMDATFGKNWRESVKVVLAGDDTTDEDAMRMLKGENSFSFRVTKERINTCADYLLESPQDVGQLLHWIFVNC